MWDTLHCSRRAALVSLLLAVGTSAYHRQGGWRGHEHGCLRLGSKVTAWCKIVLQEKDWQNRFICLQSLAINPFHLRISLKETGFHRSSSTMYVFTLLIYAFHEKVLPICFSRHSLRNVKSAIIQTDCSGPTVPPVININRNPATNFIPSCYCLPPEQLNGQTSKLSNSTWNRILGIFFCMCMSIQEKFRSISLMDCMWFSTTLSLHKCCHFVS